MRTATTVFGFLLLLLVSSASSKETPRSLLENGSFEAVSKARPPKDAGQGVWTFGADGRAPTGWSLNAVYPGRLTVLETGARSGTRCIRVEARAASSAQIFRPCPAIRPGRWFRITAYVRDGAATLLAYEYLKDGSVKPYSLAQGVGPAGTWRSIVGFYMPVSEDFRSASVALLVPRGSSAVLDDVRVEEMGGAASGKRQRPVHLENKAVEFSISSRGRLESFILKSDGSEYAEVSAPMPVLTAVRHGVRFPVGSLKKSGSTLTARFADPAIVVKLRVSVRDNHFLFEVVGAKPKDLDALELRFPVRPLRVRDSWMPGTYDDVFGICLMGVTANAETRLGRVGNAVAPEVRWSRQHGIKGGRSALVATGADRFLQAIQDLEKETGLPSPMLWSGAPGETGSTDWARCSPALRRSYLFATSLGPDDLDALIRYAKIGGFGLIMLQRRAWRASAGHETIATKAFPGGLPDLVSACEKIHAAGLGVGLHLFGPFVSPGDAYVTPVPDARLFTTKVASLAARVGPTDTELLLEKVPDLPRVSSPGRHPGNLLRIGDEIVRWREVLPGKPCRLVGCERGALGTKAAAHRLHTEVRSFVMHQGGLLVDPDTTLPEEMGKHLARVVNATRADLVYFDGMGGAPAGHQPDNWYYVNRVLLASCAAFDHGVLVQTSNGPGRQLAWHLVPRSASADGHGDLKGYLDRRLAGIRQMRRTFTAADIGWYALDVHGKPDELEYVCAKALAADASISVQAYKALLETHPRAREVFEMIARWEYRRLADDVPPEIRKRLLAKGRDFRLLQEGDEGSLWEAAYEVERPIPALDGKANRWTLANDRSHPVRWALEIRRDKTATTPAAHASPNAVSVIDLQDLTAFGDSEDPVLLANAQIGDRKLDAEGLARRGVTARLTPAKAVPGGGPGATFAADSTINGAGWCATGRRLAEVRDLSGSKALGFWVRGDGHGETFAVFLLDRAGRRARFDTTIDFEGWRFRSFKLPRGLDASKIEHVMFELSHIPPRAKVRVGVAAIRAVPVLEEVPAIRGLKLAFGERTLRLDVPLAAGSCVTVDALGRCTYWPGGMAAGQDIVLEGGPLILPPGSQDFEVSVDPPEGYVGDLFVRGCAMWPLAE